MIHLLPQLPVKNRYTEDWLNTWVRELNGLDIQFIIWGKHPKPVEITKYFTDPRKALIEECEQIKDLAKCNPKKIFCLDIDFPGLLSSAIPVLKLMNPELKCYGYLHAGSWCNGDIFSNTPGKGWMELASFKLFDKIFVATNYHKEKIQRYFRETLLFGEDEIVFESLEVVGFPFYKKDVFKYAKPLPFEEKEGILVTGRVEQSDLGILNRLKEEFGKEVVFLVQPGSREEYFHLLNQKKIVVSLKTEETFGINQLEAYVLGSIPLSPNRFSYPEVIGDERLLYNNEEDLIVKLRSLIELKENPFQIDVEKYEQSISNCMKFVE